MYNNDYEGARKKRIKKALEVLGKSLSLLKSDIDELDKVTNQKPKKVLTHDQHDMNTLGKEHKELTRDGSKKKKKKKRGKKPLWA